MTLNPYPIQIKKVILFNLIFASAWIAVICLVITIFSSTVAFYTAIILGILLAIGMGWSLLYMASIDYSLDKKSLTFKGGVISRFEKIIPYSKIQHVIVYESLVQRILGLSSLSVETAREGRVIPTNILFNRGQNITIQAGPLIPNLKKEDAEKLKNSIISVANKFKAVAGI